MLLRTLVTTAIVGAAVASPVAFRPAAPLNAGAPVAMATFTVDASHSQVLFKVRHLGISTVTGRFGTFSGTFQLDPASGQAGAASMSIDVASINTDNERRNGHLKSPDFFAADSFPKITFASTGIQKVSGNTYKVSGNLTMRGVTKPVVLDAEVAGTRQTAEGWLAAVNMSGTVKRKDYGLMWDRVTEGVAVVSDEITLLIEVEAKAPCKRQPVKRIV
ncbi:MAG: YceI family protein, partial [Gemmatimonadaceae bacterium]|nr:YceI family protein [Gemmatimonadaceae bacterium]